MDLPEAEALPIHAALDEVMTEAQTTSGKVSAELSRMIACKLKAKNFFCFCYIIVDGNEAITILQ